MNRDDSDGKTALEGARIAELIAGLDGWVLRGDKYLCKEIEVGSFARGLELFNRLGEIPEKKGQHSDIRMSSRNVRIEITNRDIEGLSEDEFELAAEMNRILDELRKPGT